MLFTQTTNTTNYNNFEAIKAIKERIEIGISIRKETFIQTYSTGHYMYDEQQYGASSIAQGDRVLAELLALDMDCPFDVLRWIQDYQVYTVHPNVTVPSKDILALFSTYGLFPNMFTWVNPNDLSKMEEAKWLIGQALNDLESTATISTYLPSRIKQFHIHLLGKLSDM